MVQLVQLVYAGLIVAESDELDRDVLFGQTFGLHTLDQVFDELSDVSGLPLGVCQDVEAERPLGLRRGLTSHP